MKYSVDIISVEHEKVTSDTKRYAVENKKELFNPYDYGQEDGISSWGAAVLIIKACIGSTFLLMPYIMKDLGYVTGTITVITTGIVYYHTIHSLLSTEKYLCKELNLKQLSYIEVTEKTFQRSPFPLNKLHTTVSYLMYFYYSLPTSNAAYLVLIANGIQSLIRRFNMNIKITYIISVEIIPLTMSCMVPKIIDILVPYSSITNIMTLFMAFGIITSSFIQRKAHATLRPFGNIYSIPECVAKCVKAYCCTAMTLPVKSDMKRPQQLTSNFGALNVAATTVITYYYLFGIILSANYGDEVKPNILFNLPTENYLTDIINLFYTSSLFVSYILIFFSRHNNIWSGPLKKSAAGKKYQSVVECGIRLGMNMMAYLLAIAVPNLALISAFSGTAGFVVDVALPSILELLTEITNENKNGWILFKNCIISGVCFVLFFISLTSCIKQVILLYSP